MKELYIYTHRLTFLTDKRPERYAKELQGDVDTRCLMFLIGIRLDKCVKDLLKRSLIHCSLSLIDM